MSAAESKQGSWLLFKSMTTSYKSGLLSTPDFWDPNKKMMPWQRQMKYMLYKVKQPYPSGTCTFFCAFEATGFSSPRNSDDTSSEQSTPK